MTHIDGYEIDIAETESHVFESDVTEHPVETGSVVTDHVRNKPAIISFQGVVSNTPIGELAVRRGMTDETSGIRPGDDAYARLIAIREARQPVTIETSRGVFADMVMQSLSEPRDPTTGDAFVFQVTFKQIRFVTNNRTTVPVAVPRAARTVNRGNVPTKDGGISPARAAARERNRKAEEARRGRQSILSKGTEAIFGRSWITGGE